MKRNATTQNACLYCRVSTTEQSETGVSLALQEERLRHYAAMRGLNIVGTIIEAGVSGGIPLEQRPGGEQVVRMVASGSVSHVLALKLDRLFRDCADCLTTIAGWDKHGIALHLVDLGGQTLDTGSAMGRFFLTVMAGAAELERNLIGERTTQALQHKKSKGQRVSGRIPYGSQLAVNGIDLEAHPTEQHIITLARQYHAEGLSSRQVSARLLSQGFFSRADTPFTPSAILAMLAA